MFFPTNYLSYLVIFFILRECQTLVKCDISVKCYNVRINNSVKKPHRPLPLLQERIKTLPGVFIIKKNYCYINRMGRRKKMCVSWSRKQIHRFIYKRQTIFNAKVSILSSCGRSKQKWCNWQVIREPVRHHCEREMFSYTSIIY